MAGDSNAVKRAAKLADAWFPSPMVSLDGVGKLDALFRETRAAAGLPPVAEYPIIRECHVGSGSGNALDEVREPLSFKYEAYASWGGASGFVPAERIRANFDTFAADRFIIGSESQVVDLIGRYGERTGTDHMLLRVQMAGPRAEDGGADSGAAGSRGGEAEVAVGRNLRGLGAPLGVILSAAKDLIAACHGHEILRCAQDDME